jgi:hypothetical protein
MRNLSQTKKAPLLVLKDHSETEITRRIDKNKAISMAALPSIALKIPIMASIMKRPTTFPR